MKISNMIIKKFSKRKIFYFFTENAGWCRKYVRGGQKKTGKRTYKLIKPTIMKMQFALGHNTGDGDTASENIIFPALAMIVKGKLLMNTIKLYLNVFLT